MNPRLKPHLHPYTINALLIGLLVSIIATLVLWVLTERPLTSVCLCIVPLILALVSLRRLFKYEAPDSADEDKDVPPPLNE